MSLPRLVKYQILHWRRVIISFYNYCSVNVWNETENSWKINFIKTINLSIRSFLDKKLQQKACALTFSTVLAIVPVLAMLFAICRGFGFQNLLQAELFKDFPSQQKALESAFSYVDAYLAQSSQGVFVGVGVLFLLWTLISLMSNVEESFNNIWGIRKGRTFYRKVTDYTAMFIFLPILIICSEGISIFMSSTVQTLAPFRILSPVLYHVLDFMPLVIAWIFFTLAFWLIPNTKVNLKNAFLAGVLCGTVFQILQWLFVSGQIYVSKYNAIYGSFAFLPLLLVWLQLSWLIALSGVVITFSSQNIFHFNFSDNIEKISYKYLNEMTIIVLAIIVNRFQHNKPPLSGNDITKYYQIPIILVNVIIERLNDANLISTVLATNADSVLSYQPAFNVDKMTVNSVREILNQYGKGNFVPKVDDDFGYITTRLNVLYSQQLNSGDILIKDLFKNDND